MAAGHLHLFFTAISEGTVFFPLRTQAFQSKSCVKIAVAMVVEGRNTEGFKLTFTPSVLFSIAWTFKIVPLWTFTWRGVRNSHSCGLNISSFFINQQGTTEDPSNPHCPDEEASMAAALNTWTFFLEEANSPQADAEGGSWVLWSSCLLTSHFFATRVISSIRKGSGKPAWPLLFYSDLMLSLLQFVQVISHQSSLVFQHNLFLFVG